MTSRRLRIAIVALPVWIVMILTGGQWCLMPGSAPAHPVVSSASMVGHAAQVGPHAGRHVAAHGVAHRVTHDGAADDAAASASTQPDADHSPRSCESQTACSVAFAPAPIAANEAVTVARAEQSRREADRLASRSLTPELPPPRA